MKIKRIFLDLDGVVRDWCEGMRLKYGIDFPDEQIDNWDWVTRLVTSYNKITEKEFWDAQGEDFWVGLQKTKDADEIISMCEDKCPDNVYILTAPTLNNAGWSQQWIRKNMPSYFHAKKYLIGPPKYVCANKTSLLIDDKEDNINQWYDEGGLTFLYPQPWNQGRGLAHVAVDELKDFLEIA